MSDALIDVPAFDGLTPPAAAALLRPSCASTAWVEAMVTGRPYGSLDAVLVRSDAVLADCGWADLEQALAAHPRIGERSVGADREASWSRDEQSGTDRADADALRAGNVEYEQRFGHTFLICATGRTSAQLLDALRARLGNDALAEREVVRAELTAIVGLRLAKTLR